MPAPPPDDADGGPLPNRPGIPEGLTLTILAVMAVVEAARGTAALGHTGTGAGAGGLTGAVLLAVASCCLSVPALRTHPILALGPALLAPLAAAAAGWDPIVEWSASSFFTFIIAAWSLPWWFVGPVTAVANVLSVLIAARTAAPNVILADTVPSTIAAVLAPCIAALLGEALRSQRVSALETERRHRQALDTRRAQTERAVAEERLRIARDLHDGVGHRVAVLSMQLGAAEVHAADPDALHDDLAAARATVQQLLYETQSVLRFLRRTDNAPASATRPVASHERVPDLVDEAQAAGAVVEADLVGLERPLPAQISAAVYRIVQEALTNALRHGRGTVRLSVMVDDDRVLIIVTNRIRSTASGRGGTGTGFGLTGARERAASVGGTVTTSVRGSGTGHVFILTAELPSLTSANSPEA